MDLQIVGSFIAKLRKEQGLTQEQLGEKLGVSNKTDDSLDEKKITYADRLLCGSAFFFENSQRNNCIFVRYVL